MDAARACSGKPTLLTVRAAGPSRVRLRRARAGPARGVRRRCRACVSRSSPLAGTRCARLSATMTAMRSWPTTLPLSRISRMRPFRNSAASRSAERSSYGQATTYSFSMIRTLTRAGSARLMRRAPESSGGRSWLRRGCAPAHSCAGARRARRTATRVAARSARFSSFRCSTDRDQLLDALCESRQLEIESVFLWCRSCLRTIERRSSCGQL